MTALAVGPCCARLGYMMKIAGHVSSVVAWRALAVLLLAIAAIRLLRPAPPSPSPSVPETENMSGVSTSLPDIVWSVPSIPAERLLSPSAIAASNPVERAATDLLATQRIATPPRLSLPFVDPAVMISAPAADMPAKWTETEPPSNLVAHAYIRKDAILSRTPDSLDEAWMMYARRPDALSAIAPPAVVDPAATITAAAAPAVAVAVPPDDPDRFSRAMYALRKAESYLNDGLVDRAWDSYQEARALYPKMTYANRQLGRISITRGDYGEAIEYLTAALDATEELPETLNDLGIALLYHGQAEQALRNFESATEADPDATEPVFNAGLALRRLDAREAARARFERHAAMAGPTARTLRELAVLDVMDGRIDVALTRLREAIERDSTWYIPYLDAALLLAQRGEVASALRHLELALELAPLDAVLKVYNQPAFNDIKLSPESQPFEARVAAKARAMF